MFSKLLCFGALASPIFSQILLDIPDQIWKEHLDKANAITLYSTGLGSQVSPVKWGECPSDHAYDMASGKSNPQIPIVG
jgi:hypothetical protein